MPDVKKIAAATAGVAAAAGIAIAAKRKMNGGNRRKNGGSDPTVVYHVKTDGDRWSTEAEGAERAHRTHDTKKEAVAAARALAGKNPPSRLVIHRSDGTIQRQHTYDVT